MIIMGLYLLVLGGKQYHVTMFLAGQWSVCALIMIIMFAAVYPKDSPLWVVWLTLVISLGFGSGIGYAAAKWARVGVLFIGAWMGGLIGGLLYTLVFYLFSQSNPLLGVWLSIAIPSLIIAIASMIYFDQAVIIGSAIGGAYVLARVSLKVLFITIFKLGYLSICWWLSK